MTTIGANPVLSPRNGTVRWIAAAADDPGRRLPHALPPELDFGPWADLLRSLQAAALPDSQLGASLLMGPDGLEIASEMAWRSRYPAIVDGKRFIGTVHVHPRGGRETFDAADLASFLRSDYPGFLDLLVTAESASAVIRTRRFLYISAERVDRDPLLLEQAHPGFRAPAAGAPSPAGGALGQAPQDARAEARAAAEAQAAVRAVCHLYELALYGGTIDAPLHLVYPRRRGLPGGLG
jgi:hypothetical protein